MILESCVNSALSALEARSGGADRVELCENMADGGCTPSAGSIITARKLINIDLFVMMRPRGGDFLYSPEEFEIMKEDILTAKKAGADGVVFGILNPDGSVDTKRMQSLTALARPMGITFHRAFDMTSDPFRALEDLIGLGIDRILTSGQQPSVLQGAPLIRELIAKAAGRIIIMPGGGIREHNIREVVKTTGASEFHLYLTKSVPSGMMFHPREIHLGRGGNPENEVIVADREKISRVKKELDSITNSP